MNLYANLSQWAADAGRTGTADNAEALIALEDASRIIDDDTGRQLFSELGTWYPDPWDGAELDGDPVLWLSGEIEDLATLTTLKAAVAAAGTYEITLVADDDYWLVREKGGSNKPYIGIVLNGDGQLSGGWPKGRKRVQIVGRRGYSNQVESAGTLANPGGGLAASAAATTATMTAGHSVSAGDTLYVESEDIYVGAVATNALSGLIRGVNGTTAATHVDGTAVAAYRYAGRARRACLVKANDILRGGKGGYGGTSGSPEFGGFASRDAYYEYQRLIGQLRRVHF